MHLAHLTPNPAFCFLQGICVANISETSTEREKRVPAPPQLFTHIQAKIASKRLVRTEEVDLKQKQTHAERCIFWISFSNSNLTIPCGLGHHSEGKAWVREQICVVLHHN